MSHVDYLESELSRALEWLHSNRTMQLSHSTHSASAASLAAQRRFAACVMLQQLAKHAPTIFFARINEFFDLIWGPIWDPKDYIRFATNENEKKFINKYFSVHELKIIELI